MKHLTKADIKARLREALNGLIHEVGCLEDRRERRDIAAVTKPLIALYEAVGGDLGDVIHMKMALSEAFR